MTQLQMEVLSNLPQLISGSKTDVDLALMLCGMLLEAIPPAVAVAVALFEESDVLEMRRHDAFRLRRKRSGEPYSINT